MFVHAGSFRHCVGEGDGVGFGEQVSFEARGVIEVIRRVDINGVIRPEGAHQQGDFLTVNDPGRPGLAAETVRCDLGQPIREIGRAIAVCCAVCTDIDSKGFARPSVSEMRPLGLIGVSSNMRA